MAIDRILRYTPSLPDYLEYGWVCAANTAGQSISANTVTTLTIDTEISDSGGHGSVSANQVTLAAGTYYFEANVPIYQVSGYDTVLSLYNVTDASYVTRRKIAYSFNGDISSVTLIGQFTIASSKTFAVQALCAGGSSNNGVGTSPLTLGTSGADQRTTLKLWKLA